MINHNSDTLIKKMASNLYISFLLQIFYIFIYKQTFYNNLLIYVWFKNQNFESIEIIATYYKTKCSDDVNWIIK